MLALHEAVDGTAQRPLAYAVSVQAERLGDAFRRVVFAQVRISLINTAFTAIYLAVVLPLFGIHLPLTKTMIAITFIAGLLPVIGNLISNTVIVIVSLAYSPYIAIASLMYLVVIHKLEYFLNARIIGSRIQSPRLGAPDRDARDGGRVRRRRGGRGADLLRLRQSGAGGAGTRLKGANPCTFRNFACCRLVVNTRQIATFSDCCQHTCTSER